MPYRRLSHVSPEQLGLPQQHCSPLNDAVRSLFAARILPFRARRLPPSRSRVRLHSRQ